MAIVPDGGRRWARRTNSPLVEAYSRSFLRLGNIIEALYRNTCSEVSVYCLSRANLGRSVDELSAVFAAFQVLAETVNSLRLNGICRTVSLIGALDLLPSGVQASLRRIESQGDAGTGTGVHLNLLICYDAWDEVRAATSKNGVAISIEDLWVRTTVDAIIRTGGGFLTSGLLPLQSQYAHLVVTEVLFNDLTSDDISELVRRAVSVRHRLGL